MMQYLNLHITEERPYLSLSHKKIADIHATTKQYAEMEIRMDAMDMGWIIDTKNNIIWHNGGTSNFNSYIAFDKKMQIGVVILSNLPSDYRLPTSLMGTKLIRTLEGDADLWR